MTPLTDLLRDGAFAGLAMAAAPYLRALAAVLPAVTLVPALSVRGLPGGARFAVAIGLAMPLAGSFAPPATLGALPLSLVSDALRGVPLAIVLATPLWAASHVGALADQLRGVPDVTQAPPKVAEGARGPLATLTAMLAASVWLSSGGVVRGLLLLARVGPRSDGDAIAPWALAARTLTDALRLSIALASGVLVAALALEVALAAIARAGAPLSPQPLAYVARPLVAVLALALSLDVALRWVG